MQLHHYKLLNRAKTVSLYGLGQAIPMVAQLIISLLIIKKYSTALWGEYVTLLLWVNFIIIFSYFGNKSYLLKEFSEQPGKIYTTWLSNFCTRFLVLLFIGLLVFFIPLFHPFLIPILIWMFLLFYNQSFEVLILYQKDFKFNFFTELVRNSAIIGIVLFLPEVIQLELFLYVILGGLFIKTLCYTVYYRKVLLHTKASLDKQSLLASLPFLIPMVLGTLRTKVDSYYGTIYFTKEDLSEYQIFISLISVVQLGVAYMINPFIKNFYRISKKTRIILEKQFFYLGIGLGSIAIIAIYCVISYLYQFTFSTTSYILGYLFMSTLFIHVLLINEFYKNNKQTQVAYITGTILLLQIIFGYFIIDTYQSTGALIIKVAGQCVAVFALLAIREKFIRSSNIRT
ncbi:lipopolysaccharide biosynthesis protein [Winogradskyella sp. A3E31]|uniref:lipopolysaccharide biosynthesis protein n=1 Tax=Winogradskyella sp. A3E31 TaxID=3349637 RepID=UPI00398B3E59